MRPRPRSPADVTAGGTNATSASLSYGRHGQGFSASSRPATAGSRVPPPGQDGQQPPKRPSPKK